jgi:hypothetical protein
MVIKVGVLQKEKQLLALKKKRTASANTKKAATLMG